MAKTKITYEHRAVAQDQADALLIREALIALALRELNCHREDAVERLRLGLRHAMAGQYGIALLHVCTNPQSRRDKEFGGRYQIACGTCSACTRCRPFLAHVVAEAASAEDTRRHRPDGDGETCANGEPNQGCGRTTTA